MAPAPVTSDALGRPAFDPAPPGDAPSGRPPRWCGNHPAELRWQLELYRLFVDPVFHGHGVPHGDGRPVLLIPGFGAGDYALVVMRNWLRRIGYSPYTAGFVTNTGCSNGALERVAGRVELLSRSHGRRVALIGHSRGGHFARAMARRRPDQVSHAIALAANLRRMLGISAPTQGAVALARGVQRRLGRLPQPGCLTDTCGCEFALDFRRPFPEQRVRLTSIYSKGDGVVRWQGCLVPYADCVEVTGSHVGLIFNRKAYLAVGHALAAPELQG
jgi:triacylglycerol lipase